MAIAPSTYRHKYHVTANNLINALSELAMEFRGASIDKRPTIVSAYNAKLRQLLATGWDDWLEPDEELPDELMDKGYLSRRISAPHEEGLARFYSFLAERLKSHDALLIDRVKVEKQVVSARILHAYTAKHEGLTKYKIGSISFVGTPGSWGNPTLTDNDKALVFVGYLKHSERYYQHHWLAHFPIFDLNGQEFALVRWNLNGNNWWPTEFHEYCVTLDNNQPWEVAIPFTLFEKHLKVAIDASRQ